MSQLFTFLDIDSWLKYFLVVIAQLAWGSLIVSLGKRTTLSVAKKPKTL